MVLVCFYLRLPKLHCVCAKWFVLSCSISVFCNPSSGQFDIWMQENCQLFILHLAVYIYGKYCHDNTWTNYFTPATNFNEHSLQQYPISSLERFFCHPYTDAVAEVLTIHSTQLYSSWCWWWEERCLIHHTLVTIKRKTMANAFINIRP